MIYHQLILEELRGLGFTWTRIAKILNVSCSTIHRHVTDHGLEGLIKFSDITYAEPDHVIEDYISRHGPTTGQSYLIKHQRSLGLRVQCDGVKVKSNIALGRKNIKDCHSSLVVSAMTRITERAISTPLKLIHWLRKDRLALQNLFHIYPAN